MVCIHILGQIPGWSLKIETLKILASPIGHTWVGNDFRRLLDSVQDVFQPESGFPVITDHDSALGDPGGPQVTDAALNLLGDVASGCLGGIDDGLVKPDLDGEVAADVDEVVDFEPGEDRGLGAHMKPPSVPTLALQHVRSLTQ